MRPREMNVPKHPQWHPTPALLPGESHGQRSLVDCSPWGRWGSDTTERLHFHFSLSCIGEGNGNPLQCSCLENPRDGGAWWAAVYGVAQSRTRLKWLSSSSKLEIIPTVLKLTVCQQGQTEQVITALGADNRQLSPGLPRCEKCHFGKESCSREKTLDLGRSSREGDTGLA